MEQIYRQVAVHNSDAIETAETIKKGLVVVKCASTIVVSALALPWVMAELGAYGIAAGSSSIARFGVGAAYSVGITLIKHWSHTDAADLVAVSTGKAAQKTGQKIVKDVAKTAGINLESKAALDLGKAERKIEWLTKRLANGGRERDVRRLVRAQGAAEAAKSAGRWAVGMKAVPYLFFAWTAVDAVTTAQHERGN